MGHFLGGNRSYRSAECALALLGGAVSVIGLIPKLPPLLSAQSPLDPGPTAQTLLYDQVPIKDTPPSTWFSNKVDDPRFILPDVASPARTHSFGDDGRTLGFHILCLFKSGLGSPGASLAMY